MSLPSPSPSPLALSSRSTAELCARIFEQLSREFSVENSAYLSEDWPPNIANFGSILLGFLAEYLDPAKGIDASQCAGQINKALPSMSQEKFGAGVTLEMWSIILAAAGLIPFTHEMQDRLAALIVEVKNLPESETLPVLGDDIAFEKVRISEMPGLLVTYDDYHSWLGSFSDLPEESEGNNDNTVGTAEDQDNTLKAMNLDAFIARIYARDIGDYHLPVRGLWLFRLGPLENPVKDQHRLTWGVQTCAIWIMYAGHAFYSWRYKPHSDDDDYEQRALIGGELWHGKPGMSTERWNFWKQRFRQLASETSDLVEETREMALNAAALMEKIETAQ